MGFNGMGGMGFLGGLGGGFGMGGMGGNPMMMMLMMLMSMMQMMRQMSGMQQCPGMGQGGIPGLGDGMGFNNAGGAGVPYSNPASYGADPSMNAAPGPYNAVTGSQLANTALQWQGRAFKPGQTARCADFVSTMIEQSGTAPPGFQHQESAEGLTRYGQPVNMRDLKPGDVVFFGNTYRPGRYTHTGIYIGNGKFVHRPTANSPVKVDDITSGYYSSKFSGARRMSS